MEVLNLVINGIPSIQSKYSSYFVDSDVLNLVINGIPSIRWDTVRERKLNGRFKPCYKWNTFNTVYCMFGSPILSMF